MKTWQNFLQHKATYFDGLTIYYAEEKNFLRLGNAREYTSPVRHPILGTTESEKLKLRETTFISIIKELKKLHFFHLNFSEENHLSSHLRLKWEFVDFRQNSPLLQRRNTVKIIALFSLAQNLRASLRTSEPPHYTNLSSNYSTIQLRKRNN